MRQLCHLQLKHLLYIRDSDGGYYLETITETLSSYPLTYGTYSTNTKTKTKTISIICSKNGDLS